MAISNFSPSSLRKWRSITSDSQEAKHASVAEHLLREYPRPLLADAAAAEAAELETGQAGFLSQKPVMRARLALSKCLFPSSTARLPRCTASSTCRLLCSRTAPFAFHVAFFLEDCGCTDPSKWVCPRTKSQAVRLPVKARPLFGCPLHSFESSSRPAKVASRLASTNLRLPRRQRWSPARRPNPEQSQAENDKLSSQGFGGVSISRGLYRPRSVECATWQWTQDLCRSAAQRQWPF